MFLLADLLSSEAARVGSTVYLDDFRSRPLPRPFRSPGRYRDGGSWGVAFVLGGGGHLRAREVGMLKALLERGIVPSMVVGTSVGAINGALIATDPTVAAAGAPR